MKKIVGALAFFMLLCIVGGFAGSAKAQHMPEGQIVAVFPIQDLSGKLDKKIVDSLTEYLAAAIAETGVFSIQAPGDMRRVLQQKKTESYEGCFDERCQIELGKELAANKILSSKIIRLGDTCTVTAALYDLKTQATDITATADGKCLPANLKTSIDTVAGRVRAWASGHEKKKEIYLKEGQLGERVKRLQDSNEQDVIVQFQPHPDGSVVIVDGVLVCETTPCSRKFAVGTHMVSIQKKRYMGRQEQVIFSQGTKLDWTLEPLFGQLTVSSAPSGLDVLINGEQVGKTPLEGFALDPGNYDVLVSNRCYYDKGQRIHMEARQQRELAFEIEPKLGGLEVDVKDSSGNDIPAELFVDGKKLGESPGKFKVSVCARKILARSGQHGVGQQTLELEEGQWKHITVDLNDHPRHQARQQRRETNAKEDKKFALSFSLSPTFGYASVKGLSADVLGDGTDTTSSSSLGIGGPIAGFRMDLNLGSLLAVVARYDYLFLDHAGVGLLGGAVGYGQLWSKATEDEDEFAFLTDVSMVVGFSFVHGDAASFEDDMQRKPIDSIANFGLVASIELRGIFRISSWFFIAASGEFGYITSFGQGDSSSAGGYEWVVRGEAGITL